MVLHTQKASSLKKRRATSLASELICVCNDQLYEAPIAHWKLLEFFVVHLKHLDGHIEEVTHSLYVLLGPSLTILAVSCLSKVPYFCLPANELADVIAPSCYR
ncbi:hypothetical protein Peur_042038 [Populus x canadensis]